MVEWVYSYFVAFEYGNDKNGEVYLVKYHGWAKTSTPTLLFTRLEYNRNTESSWFLNP